MGLLYHAIKVPKLLTFTFFVNIFANATYFFIGALTHLGLYKLPPRERDQENAGSRDGFNGYVLIVDPTSPSLVSVPVHAVKTAVKSKLPVVHYSGEDEHDDEKEEPLSISEEKIRSCTVCLDFIELGDEVRELCNCKHRFHKDCLDRWVDEGQITCPLCRSMLLQPRTILECYHRTNREAILHRCHREAGL